MKEELLSVTPYDENSGRSVDNYWHRDIFCVTVVHYPQKNCGNIVGWMLFKFLIVELLQD